jgi:hypothetical protein
MKNFLKTALILLSFTAFSCKKVTTNTIQDVTIDILSPTPNQQFALGDTIKVIAKVTSNKEIHGYSLVIKKISGGQVKNNSDHEHGTSLTINKYWVNNLTESSDMIADITVELDHDGSTTTKSVIFKCHP